MTKKDAHKKLRIAKSTVKPLQSADLRQVNGGTGWVIRFMGSGHSGCGGK